jgi:hypothetical protein
MGNLSQFTKNGQTFQLKAGAAALAQGDLVEIGGPGLQAYTVNTIDYARSAPAGTLLSQTSLVAAALPGADRQPVVRDTNGNIIILGTNSSGNLVAYKETPLGASLASATLDATASTVRTPRLLTLGNNTFAGVYARASGALYFVVFDAVLTLIAGPTSIATEYNSSSVVYHDACATSISQAATSTQGSGVITMASTSGIVVGQSVAGPGVPVGATVGSIVANTSITLASSAVCSASAGAGTFVFSGFAVVFQSSAGTQIQLATYNNAGGSITAATNIQTLASTVAQEYLRIGQLSSGNLVVGFRGAMTAGGTAGTGFVVVSTAGANQAGPTNVDSTATAGLLELNIMAGFFAFAEGNGTNLKAAIYSNAGAIQGAAYSVADTLNSVSQPQVKLTSDGIQFWLTYIGSAAAGVNVVQLPTTGTGYQAVTGLSSASITSSFGIDAAIINGLLTVFAASSGTGGQYWLTVGLPDASQGISLPYLRTGATAFGSAAGTTGSSWPRIVSGGDWTAIFCYDQQSTAATFLGIQKVEASAIEGVNQTAMAVGNNGTPITVNGGPGEYLINAVLGTQGQTFNHSGFTPGGAVGVLFANGISLGSTTVGVSGTGSSGSSNISQLSNTVGQVPGYLGIFGNGSFQVYSQPGTYTFTAPYTGWYRVRVLGGAGSGAVVASTNANNLAQGGCGAGYGLGLVFLTQGQQVTVTVGAGGTGATAIAGNGNAGSSSSFGTFITATGGPGGNQSFAASPTLPALTGGTASFANGVQAILASTGGGQPAMTGYSGQVATGGAGAGSQLGNGGTPAMVNPTSHQVVTGGATVGNVGTGIGNANANYYGAGSGVLNVGSVVVAGIVYGGPDVLGNMATGTNAGNTDATNTPCRFPGDIFTSGGSAGQSGGTTSSANGGLFGGASGGALANSSTTVTTGNGGYFAGSGGLILTASSVSSMTGTPGYGAGSGACSSSVSQTLNSQSGGGGLIVVEF